jgi:ABC-type phosphate/phosphonate transport system substrate-binding protein
MRREAMSLCGFDENRMAKLFIILLFLSVSSLFFVTGFASANDVKIGVLNIRGSQDKMKLWQQIADSLNAGIPEYHFVIETKNYNDMEKAVANKQLEFVVANPTEYIGFEVKYGVSRIATQISHVGQKESSYIGSVIFTKANRTDIKTLSDLRGKSLATASKTAFASWLVTRDELKHQGVSSGDLASIQLTGSSSDKVVMAVKNGEADAGSIITSVLEQMEQEGKISLSDFSIINQKHVEGYPFLLSSELYPNFAFARLKHTDIRLANRVAAQLLNMTNDIAKSNYLNDIGWTVPDNYENVRRLMEEWRIPPYEEYGKVTLGESIRQHWDAIVLAFVSVIALFSIVLLSHNLKQRKIKFINLEVEKQNLKEHHELVLEQRDLLTRQKLALEAALAQVKLLEGIIPICSYCKKIRDDQNSWQQLEQYISGHSEAKFSHGICPHCFEEQIKVIENMK